MESSEGGTLPPPEPVKKSSSIRTTLKKINPFNILEKATHRLVTESRIPTEKYKSTMELNGGKIVTDPQGKMVLDRRGFATQVDVKGDSVLRNFDDHQGRETKHWRILKRHPRLFFRSLLPGPKRYRTGDDHTLEQNIQRLGLGEYYGPHPWGIEVKKPELFTKGVPFQDIFRADVVESPQLLNIDRFQAIAEVAKYLRYIHTNFGAVGEGVPYRFIFENIEGNTVNKPVLFIPDVIYNGEKQIGGLEQKATDVLEFLAGIGIEELRRSNNDLASVKKALETAIQAYEDPQVLGLVGSFAKRDRLNLKGPTSIHNKYHLQISVLNDSQRASLDNLRQMIIDSTPALGLAEKYHQEPIGTPIETDSLQNPNTQDDPSPS